MSLVLSVNDIAVALPSLKPPAFCHADRLLVPAPARPGGFSGNCFSEDASHVDRRAWFVNQNYGGCGNDAGWMVVEFGGGGFCGWESSRPNASGRALIDTTGNTRHNRNSDSVASATVFAITVETAPEPSTVLLVGSAFAVLGLLHRRRA
jgi:hypothetical protein